MNTAAVSNTNAATTSTTPSTTSAGSAQNAAYPTTYQEYYQQYMQYMYSMNLYGNYPAYAQTAATSSTTNTVSNFALTAPPPPPPPSSDSQQQQVKSGGGGPIKFNLKFQQQQQPKLLIPQIKQQQPQNATTSETTPTRKSRFDVTTPNVVKQQSLYKQYQQKQREKLASTPPVVVATPSPQPAKTVSAEVSSNDIISDINKWPISLKNYCSRVLQIYHANKLVSEQQVTNYLQMRITEAFKIKSDLNIDWDKEKIPDVQSIKQLSGVKQQQVQQQQQKQYNQVPPPQPLLSIQTTKPLTFQQRMLNQKLQQQQQQVSNNKRKSKSPASDRSSESSSSSIESKNKKFKKEQPKVITSKLRRNLSDDDDEEEEEEEDEEENNGYESENEEMSDEEFKPLTKKQEKFNKKQKKFQGKLAINNKNLNSRLQRFQVEIKNEVAQKQPKKKFGNRVISLFDRVESSSNLSEPKIVGLSQDLEKEYLRLTGPPDPANVRPLNVLKKSLDYILDKYSKSNDYRYVCDQLKAIRQDLTVQMIRNEFTIQVYETHARIAIRQGDRDSLNQCQSQLMNLYETVQDKKAVENAAEFIGYHLLYFILTKSSKDLNRVIIEIKRNYNENAYLNHLLKFRTAWYMNNYVMLFKLYKKSNQMSKYLIDLFIERERKLALKMIIKSYRPYLNLDKVKELLAYETINKCKENLLSYGLCIATIDSEQVLDCKSSNIQNL